MRDRRPGSKMGRRRSVGGDSTGPAAADGQVDEEEVVAVVVDGGLVRGRSAGRRRGGGEEVAGRAGQAGTGSSNPRAWTC